MLRGLLQSAFVGRTGILKDPGKIGEELVVVDVNIVPYAHMRDKFWSMC